MRILLLSAYHASSHSAWCDGLIEQYAEHEITLLSLPPRNFAWRIRGNALCWALQERERLEADYDLVIATSMVDLTALRGLVTKLAARPALLYFHENQFAYPVTAQQTASLEPQMVQLYSAVAATRLAFNSAFNCATFCEGVATLCAKLPDGLPLNLAASLQAKSRVLAVPLPAVHMPSRRAAQTAFGVIWNHRWEYDKGPEGLYAILQALPHELPLCVHTVGQQFRRVPEVFTQIKQLLEARGWLGEWGYVARRARYEQLLASGHLVLSTALHDFQGLAVLEAVQAGCLPLVPDRLAYRDFFAPQYRYSTTNEAAAAAAQIVAAVALWQRAEPLPVPAVSAWTWPALKPSYDALIAEVAAAAY